MPATDASRGTTLPSGVRVAMAPGMYSLMATVRRSDLSCAL